jgi:hypothetical protein
VREYLPARAAARAAIVAALVGVLGCARAPISQFPNAEAAISSMRARLACNRSLLAEAKVDFIDGHARVRGNVAILAALPDRTRIDVFSPFGVSLSTITTDAGKFTFFDLEHRRFVEGPANACNMARFTQVALPPFVLVQLLRGEAPILKHDAARSTLDWSSGWFGGGHYRIQLNGQNDATEAIDFVPHPDDFDRPWQEQRVRVLSVAVAQQGYRLYQAQFEGHRGVATAGPREDPDGLDAPIPPSGPACSAEIPRRMRLVVPDGDKDLVIHFERLEHNPPLVTGAFSQVRPDGVVASRAECQ